jgi:hypothetical protein
MHYLQYVCQCVHMHLRLLKLFPSDENVQKQELNMKCRLHLLHTNAYPYNI